jgi:putative YhbY family RNA-binding protein
MNPLTPAERRALRAKAHHLQPVVIVGQHGLSPAVLHEVDLALDKHELIKVRVFSDDRAAREELLEKLCAEMECAAVQHLGKVFVLWREGPEQPAPPPPPRREPKAAKKSGAKRPKPPKTGPRMPVDPVRERRRGTGLDTADSGKGRRGAARHAPAGEGSAARPPRLGSARPQKYRCHPVPRRRNRAVAAAARRSVGGIGRTGAACPGGRFQAEDPCARRRQCPSGWTRAARRQRRRSDQSAQVDVHPQDHAEIVRCQTQSARSVGQASRRGRGQDRRSGHTAATQELIRD